MEETTETLLLVGPDFDLEEGVTIRTLDEFAGWSIVIETPSGAYKPFWVKDKMGRFRSPHFTNEKQAEKWLMGDR